MHYDKPELSTEILKERRVELGATKESVQALCLRTEFISYLSQPACGIEEFDARARRWQRFVEQFGSQGVCLPSEYSVSVDVDLNVRIAHAALSGNAACFGCDSMIDVAHAILDRHPQHLATFLNLASAMGHSAAIRAQDHDGRWRQKIARLTSLRMASSARYRPDLKFSQLMKFLFPDSSTVFEDLEQRSRVDLTL